MYIVLTLKLETMTELNNVLEELNTMKLSELREVHNLCEENDLDFREVVAQMVCEEQDFEVDNFRFIAADAIDGIQQRELEGDKYMLGCFTAQFLSEITNLSYDIIVALQEGEKYEAIGEHIEEQNLIEELQQEYARLDGYGHHFAHYDHNEHEVLNYLAFRVN